MRVTPTLLVIMLVCTSFSILLFEGALAGNAQLSPPHSHHGSDIDGDGYYNFLVFNASIEVVDAGLFNVYGALYDASFTTLIVETTTQLNRPVGQATAQLKFDGLGIYDSGIDGPYGVWIVIYDDMWNALDSDSVNTDAFDNADFQHKVAEFNPPHLDYVIDTDGNSFNNYLVTDVNITVDVPGTYGIEGELYDSTGIVRITGDSVEYHFNKGNHTVELVFLGFKIRQKERDGSYKLELGLKRDGTQLIKEDVHSTNDYSYADFDGHAAYFSGPSVDDVMNGDGDDLYDYLRVSADLVVNISGEYTIRGDLFDSTLQLNYIAFGSNSSHVQSGHATVSLHFFGFKIFDSMSDDRYRVDLELLDQDHVLLHTHTHLTQAYLHDEFEHEEPASLSPPHDDYGLDADEDGLYDYLVVNVSAEFSLAGDYVFSLKLYDTANVILIATQERRTYNVPGPSVVPLLLNGDDILASGIDGLYRATIYLYDIFDNLLKKNYYDTQFYSSTDFEIPSGANLKGMVTGLVKDGDGNPIDDVLVKLSSGNVSVYEIRTDVDGSFVFEEVDEGVYDLLISESGYVQVTEKIIVLGGSSGNLDPIIMEKISETSSEESSVWMTVLIVLSVVLVLVIVVVLKVVKSRRRDEYA